MANIGFDVKWTAPQVAAWLNSEYPFSNLAPKFEGLSGSDMVGFKLQDLIAITNEALGRALYNKLPHPTAPSPSPPSSPDDVLDRATTFSHQNILQAKERVSEIIRRRNPVTAELMLSSLTDHECNTSLSIFSRAFLYILFHLPLPFFFFRLRGLFGLR
eukprot:Phypoly_transcript_15667.p1 GENE.Phypoly_transcript_15667~~Phypoly_transcript_15667.p1  ORF type:complete len:159 (+),score=14.82 Phypoly_transcript_15667:154-630(+)